MLTWNPSDILALTEDEANLDPLEAAGYKARLLPPPDEFQPIERAEHYVIVGNGDAYQLAKRFATCGAAREWQISVNQMGGFQDPDPRARQGWRGTGPNHHRGEQDVAP
jgi:hypothetical protein